MKTSINYFLLSLLSILFALPGLIVYPQSVSYTRTYPVQAHHNQKHNQRSVQLEQSLKHSFPQRTHQGPLVFSMDIPQDNALIDFYLDYFLSLEGRYTITRALDRGRPYLHFIAKRIQDYGLPPELIFLPIVESTFRIDAISRSGAAGLWQFMLNSIGPYDMNVNMWVDERRDFWKSTDGALRKLHYNYTHLGDWLLALAAYHCGLGRVSRTIAASGIDDFWELSEKRLLPDNTIRYVPRFLAAAAVASYRGRHGFPLEWTPPLEWDRIKLNQAVDLTLLSEKTGTSLDKLFIGNRELNHRITPPITQTYYLKVPVQYADTIRKSLTAEEHRFMQFAIHTIHSGDTFSRLASHYGVPVRVIQQYNSKLNPSSLRIGAEVIIPMLKKVAPLRPVEEEPLLFTASYTVRPGDTMWRIAQAHGTTPEQLARANSMIIDQTLYAGAVIKVPDLNDKEDSDDNTNETKE